MPSTTAIDLFSGCGGLTLGLRRAGFRVLAAAEIDLRAQNTYASNHARVKLYRNDVREICPKRMLKDLSLKRGQLGLLAACPPCQGFSRLRTKNQYTSSPDIRNSLIGQFIRFVEGLYPKCVMLENVPALREDRRFKKLCRELTSLGYKIAVSVLDASEYSVPQRRKRLILLGSRVHDPELARPSRKSFTVGDVFETLGEPMVSTDQLHSLTENRSERIRELISRVPKNGGSRRDLPSHLQLSCHKRTNGYKDVYGRMRWDDVAPTITSGCTNPSKGRFIHPFADRAITLREAALLQGFPINYKFDISHGKEAIALMIGNALPPPFIAAHARGLCKALKSLRV
jgi:DNA (cytosine-5)-methyltransferase 1